MRLVLAKYQQQKFLSDPNKKSLFFYFQRALKQDERGNIKEAKKLYALASLNAEKMIPQAAYNLAYIYEKENNMEKATKYYALANKGGITHAAMIVKGDAVTFSEEDARNIAQAREYLSSFRP